MGVDDDFEAIMAGAGLDMPPPPPNLADTTTADLIIRHTEIREEIRETNQIDPTTARGVLLHDERVAIRNELARRNILR